MNIIFKLQALLEKKKQLANLLLERKFISQNYEFYIELDEKEPKEDLRKLQEKVAKKIKEGKDLNGENERITELQETLDKSRHYKRLFESSFRSEKETKDFIKIIKKELWN